MVKKSKKIQSEISAGELFDKISILEIKLDKIKDENSKKEVQKSNIEMTEKLETLFKEIEQVNLDLWNVEDKLRVCEKNKNFGQAFIELARNVYLNNDKRAKIKSEINKLLGSNIREVKQYANY